MMNRIAQLQSSRLSEKIQGWIKENRVLLTNAFSLAGTAVVTSGFGFIYWWLAARKFPASEVGYATASVSAMQFLGTLSVMGLGMLLVGELPRQKEQKEYLISTALISTTAIGIVLGLVIFLLMPSISEDFAYGGNSQFTSLLFAVGVGLTASSLVIDKAVVGLLEGNLQFIRNAVFSLAKLIALLIVGTLFLNRTGTSIFATWVVGLLLSMIVLTELLREKGVRIVHLPRFRLLRLLGTKALSHHALNMIIDTPRLMMPILVTAILSAMYNAYFYSAWMIASFIFLVPSSFTLVLYAVGSENQDLLASKTRLTLRLSTVITIVAIGVMFICAPFILTLFGKSYAEEAEWCLRILSIGALPLIVKSHYITIRRLKGQILKVALELTCFMVFELGFSSLGAEWGGLTGLSIGWLIANFGQALYMAPEVFRTARMLAQRE